MISEKISFYNLDLAFKKAAEFSKKFDCIIYVVDLFGILYVRDYFPDNLGTLIKTLAEFENGKQK